MKLKRLLALVVSLAMILSVVPAFSLTASAVELNWLSTTKLTAYGYNLTTSAKRDSANLGWDGAEGAFVSWGDVRVSFAAFELPDGTTYDPATQALIGVLSMNAWDNNGGTNTAGIYPVDPTAVVDETGLADARTNKGRLIGTIRSDGGYQIAHSVSAIVDLSSAVVDGKIGLLISNIDGYGANISTYKDLALSVAVVDKEVIYQNDEGDLTKALDSEWLEIEFTMSGADAGFRDWNIVDANGNQFAGFCYAGATDGFYPQDRQVLSTGFAYVDGYDTSTKWTSDSSVMRITVIKTSSATYQVTYTIINDTTETVVAVLNYTGSPNGIKLPAEWNTPQGDTDFGFNNFKVTAVKIPETSVTVTATYTAGGEEVRSVIKTYNPADGETGVALDAYYYSKNGTNTLYYAPAQTLAESTTIEMSAVEKWNGYAVNDSVVAVDTPYLIKSANLIPNGNFADGVNGWYAADGSDALSSNFTTNAANGSVTLSGGNGGSSSVYTLQRSWAIESGKTYVFVYTQSQEGTDKKWQRFSLGNTFASNNDAMLLGAGEGDVETGQSVVYGTNIVAFTNTDGYQYANFVAAWSQGVTLSNFGLYEAEVDTARVATTTIKFVDSADGTTEIAAAVTKKGVVGAEINLADTTLAPEIIEYNGNYYTKDSSNAASYTVTGNTDTVTVTYTVDPITSFTGTPVTVIEGNTPIISTTVMGATDSGIEVEITGIVWDDCSGLTAGTHTVNGSATVSGTVVNGTVEVTVLEESFALGSADSINGGDGNVVYFPKAITDEFTVEFDYTINQIADVSVQMGYNGSTYGAAALGISPNGNQLKATGGNKTGTGEGIVLIDPVNAGETYRMLLTMDASSDTYTLTVTKPDGTTVTTGEKGFRTAQDAINTMTLRTNGGENAADGNITVSNIKVHSASIKKATVTLQYTTSDGTVVGTYTHNGYTGDSVTFPVGVYTAADGTKYDVEEAVVAITQTEHTVTVNAVKLEAVTVDYVYEGETLKTVTLYGVEGTEVSRGISYIAKDGVVYETPAVTTVVDTANPTVTATVTIASNAVAPTKTETYNVAAGAVYPYPTGADRNQALVGTDAMFSASWGDDRYGEMVFDVTTGENEDITTAVLTLTPGDVMADGYPNTFNIYAVAPESYGSTVDHASLTAVGSGAFVANDTPVDITLDLTDFDASNGVMLIYKQTNGLAGVYGASFTEAPVLKYEIREKTSATFTYVCEGAEVGNVVVEGYVGDTVSVALGYYTAEDGTKYYVDAASVVLASGENTATVNARKIETVTINYTLNGETKKTVVLEGFAGDAVIAPDVYVNVDKAVYWSEAKEYTLAQGGSTADVELVLVNNATFATTTDTFNVTQNTAMTFPEGADRKPEFFNTDAFLSASWGDNRYGEMLFDVTVPEDDIINSAQLTLMPGDIMFGFTNSFDIYAANPATFGTTANDLATLTVVGSGRFTANDVPVTVDLDLTKYDEYEEDGKVLLLYKVTSGLVGVYGASFGDNAPRLTYTTGELGARVDVSDEFVIEYAKGTLSDFDAVNPPVTIPEGSEGYLDINTAWEGITGTNSEGVSHIDVYAASVNEPIIRVVSELAAGIGEDSTPSTVTTPGYGEGAEYVLFSFNPEVGTAPWTDIGLRDLDGNLITAFRLNNAETDTICPIWGHTGTASPYKSYYVEKFGTEKAVVELFNPAGEAKATITDLVSQVDVLMRNFDPDGTPGNDDDYYTVAYMVDGNVFTVGEYPGNFNGLKDIEMACAGATVDQYGGIAAVKVYSGNEPRVIGSITANYIYKDEVVHTVTKYYDKNELEEGETKSIEFPEYYYSGLGEYLLYRVPATTLTENTDIQVVQYHETTGVVLTLLHNWSHDDLLPSDLYTASSGKTYSIATRNLIANGNFEYGVAGWYDGELGELSEVEFVPNPDNETVIIRANGTTISEYGFYNAWALEKGETYLFTYTATGLSDTYAGITQTDVIDTVSYDPTLATKLQEGKNYVVFDAESDYLKLNIGWSKNAEVGSFGLYKLDMIESTEIYRTIIEGSDPVLPKYVSTYEDGIVERVIWNADQLAALQIGENKVTGDLYTEITYAEDATDVTEEPTEDSTDVTEDEGYIVEEDGTVLVPVGETVTATVMVYPLSFTHDTINSYDGQGDLTSRDGNQKLERPITGKFAVEMDVTVENYGDLWIILNDSATTNDTSFFGNDQILISPSYFGGEIMPQNGHGDGTREETLTLMIAGRNKAYRFFITGDTEADTYSITVVSPEGISKTFEGHGFRTNTDKIDSIAMFTNSDGTGNFTATNIKVYDIEPIDVNYVLQDDENKALTTETLGEYFYGEEVTIPEGTFYLSYYDSALPVYGEEGSTDDNVAHIVETTGEQTFVVTPEHSTTPQEIYVKIDRENAVLYDTFATGTDAELNAAENLLFVGSSGVSDAEDVDDDGNATITGGGYVGAPRIPLLTFNIPDYNEGEVVMLNLYAYQANQNLGEGNSMKLAVGVIEGEVDEATVYAPDSVANLENLIWSDREITQTADGDGNGRFLVAENRRRVAVDVTDLVVKAKEAGKERITFAVYAPVAGAYIVNRESAVYGGVHQGNYAAFLEAENDTYTLTVNGASLVTKNGSRVQLVDGGTTTVYIRNRGTVARMYTDDASYVAFVENNTPKVHNIATETLADNTTVRFATVEAATMVDEGIYNPVALGVDMVDGAQVRIGGGVDESGEFAGGSGLRFITVVNATDTLATLALAENSGMEMGVKITAEGSDNVVYIPAEMWQTDGEVFTSALTNLAVTNYNRNFTAVPYIKCVDADNTELEYINAPVTRSIYKVAAGLLMKGYDTEGDDNGVDTDGNYGDNDGEETDYSSMPENLVAVLNAYVNKVGVRLTLSDSTEAGKLTARMTGSGAYTGEAFFTVGDTTYADGKYTVTLTAVGNSVINTEIFNKYVRINNNNTKVSPDTITTITDNGDGTYTIVFDYGAMTAN